MGTADRFVCIDRIDAASETALVIAALEAAGIPVRVHDFHHTANAAHMAVALQGIGVLVPADREAEARAFLRALAARDIRAEDPAPMTQGQDDGPLSARPLYVVILTVILCWWSGTAPVLLGPYQQPPRRHAVLAPAAMR